jgi:hypothetical protein
MLASRGKQRCARGSRRLRMAEYRVASNSIAVLPLLPP